MIGAWIGMRMAGPSPPPVPTLGLSLDVGRETANQTQASGRCWLDRCGEGLGWKLELVNLIRPGRSGLGVKQVARRHGIGAKCG